MSRYTNYEMANNVFGTLSAPISSLATTIQLDTGQGARFKADMLATLEHMEGNKVAKREIVLITNVSSDTLTVVRKYAACPIDDDANTQSQTSFSFDISDTINVYITKEHFDNIGAGITNAEWELDNLNYDGNSRMKVIPAISGTALKIDIVAWVYRCGQDTVQFAGQTDISVTDNATNYVMVDWAGTIQISTSSWDTRYTRLATVTCSSWAITSISDRRSDVVGGTLWGLEIHSLTEKISPINSDELVLADSEDSYVNKRVTVGNLMPNVMYVNTQDTATFSDNKDYICGIYSGSIYLTKKWFRFSRNWNMQNINVSTIYDANWTTGSPIIYNWYIYLINYRSSYGSNAKVFRCNVENDISNTSNWEYVADLTRATNGDTWALAWFDDDYFIVYYRSSSVVYIQQYDTNWNLVNTITTTFTAVSASKSFAANKKYFIGTGSSVTVAITLYLQDWTNKGVVYQGWDSFYWYWRVYSQYNASYPACPQYRLEEFDSIFPA